MEKDNPYHLIETFSGKTVARAERIEELRDGIPEKLAEYYTVHNETEGWFSSATILFKQKQAS